MITPISLPGPVPAQYAATPAGHQAGAAEHAPAIDAGQPAATGPAPDPRRVPPPSRIDPQHPQEALRSGRADAAVDGRRFRHRTGGDFGASAFAPAFEEIRAGRVRPRPSSTFLAQAIGQELGAAAGAPADRAAPRAVADLYRRTGDAVARARFGGLLLPQEDDAT